MFTAEITRKFEIDAGHRLIRHESKCAHVHGHRYVFEVTVRAEQLDQVGRVIDFSVLKEKIGAWLDAEWDHAMLVEAGDPLIPWLVEHKQRHYILPVSPTAENIVRYFAAILRRLLPRGIETVHIRLYETPNCWADYFPPEARSR
jgi:6-pyruvoyltetrahydropterin/6-carboxytetrahydropterin synthase